MSNIIYVNFITKEILDPPISNFELPRYECPKCKRIAMFVSMSPMCGYCADLFND